MAALIVALLALPARAQTPAPVRPASPAPTQQATMTDRLDATFAAASGPVDFLVILKEQPDAQALVAGVAPQARTAVLYSTLTAQAQASQAPLRAWLDAQAVPYRPYYIVNMLRVTGDAALADALLTRNDVARLAADPQMPALSDMAAPDVLPLPTGWQIVRPAEARASARMTVRAQAELPWGLAQTGAPAVWARGITGAGIVVASQDTGVAWDHPALRNAYRGWDSQTLTATHVYNWFDAFGVDDARSSRCAGDAATDAQIPCDDQGHGSHTVGTMVGDATVISDTILGMAPGAQWIGCRNMSAGVGSPSSYTTCFEWFLAPYPQDGDPFTDGKPALAPDIINNSWGCPPEEGCDDPQILRQVVATARAAGQFVAASAGNEGYYWGCSTVVDPIGIYDEVFSVGATDARGNIASFSSRGPVTVDGSGRVKPDISAPGEQVRSVALGGGFTWLSGTSMASPHVAGAVALLWSAWPPLRGDIDTTETILRASATPIATNECATSAGNNVYGAGLLNVDAAVTLAQGMTAHAFYLPIMAHQE
jgi:serine protease AprX